MSNQQGPQIVRLNNPVLCPHCTKEVIIGLEYEIPRIVAVVSSKLADDAKKAVKFQTKDIIISPDERAALEAWLEKKDTVITPADVEMVVANIKAQYGQDEPAVGGEK